MAMSLILSHHTIAQKNLLVVEKPGTIKHYTYEAGDEIMLSFETAQQAVTLQGVITQIQDSSILLNQTTAIPLKTIVAVHRRRKGAAFLTELGLKVGIAYFAIEGANGLIHQRKPVIPTRTFYITGGLLASSLTSFFLMKKTLKTDGHKWRVKTLIDPFPNAPRIP